MDTSPATPDPSALAQSIPNFSRLTPEHQAQLQAMAENMSQRGLPHAVVITGLRSTAALLLEELAARTPRIDSDPVRRFLHDNQGTPIARTSRAVPRKETKPRIREALQDQLVSLIRAAHAAKRPHEMKKLRRDMLGLDQNYIRRTLGADGATLCREMNTWLASVSRRLREE